MHKPLFALLDPFADDGSAGDGGPVDPPIDLSIYAENGFAPDLVIDFGRGVFVVGGALVSQADCGAFTAGTWPFVVPAANVPAAAGGFSTAIEGRVTYADTAKGLTGDGLISEVTFARRFVSVSEYVMLALQTNSVNTGQLIVAQERAGVLKFSNSGAQYTPGTLVPFKVASRQSATEIGGAREGVVNVSAAMAGLPSVSGADFELGAYRFVGEIDLCRVWGVDIAAAGVISATGGA